MGVFFTFQIRSIRCFQSFFGLCRALKILQTLLQQNGIISQRSCPYSPQQNGIAERKNKDISLILLVYFFLNPVPARFSPKALSTAVHLINQPPSPMLLNQSPYFRLYNIPPTYTHLRTFGCVCFVHLPPIERTKLTAQSVKCTFLGYASHHKGFLCYDPNINHTCVSRNVNIFVKQYFFPNQNYFPTSFSFSPNSDHDSPLPILVYKRRKKDVPTLSPPQDLPPAPDPLTAIVQILDALQLNGSCIWQTPSFHISVKNRIKYSSPPQKQHIVLCLQLFLK